MATSAERMRAWDGPAVLSFGFRPFFLMAGIWAAGAMVLWIAMLSGWVGPGLLLDNGRPPFVPPCTWRNVDNEALRDRAWFERPCAPGPWPPERQ